MTKCVKDLEVIDVTWRDALVHYGGRGYYLRSNGRWRTKISKNNQPSSLGVYDTEEEAAEVIYAYRVNRFLNALSKHGLNPDDAVVLANRHLRFPDGREFNLKGECLGVDSYNKNSEVQFPKEKNQKEVDRLNAEYIKRKAKDLLRQDRLRHELPRVGDKLRKRSKIPTTMMKVGFSEPTDCVVTYVNRAHLWYEVEFYFGEDEHHNPIKWKESFKLPERTSAYC